MLPNNVGRSSHSFRRILAQFFLKSSDAGILFEKRSDPMGVYASLVVFGVDLMLVGTKLSDLSFPAFCLAFVVPALLMGGYVVQGVKQDNIEQA